MANDAVHPPALSMQRLPPRSILAASVLALVCLSVAFALYVAGAASPARQPRVAPFGALFIPAAGSVVLLQAIAYPSLRRRLAASALFFLGGVLFTVVALFVIGCGFYAGCTR
jgi:hypothetical protein